ASAPDTDRHLAPLTHLGDKPSDFLQAPPRVPEGEGNVPGVIKGNLPKFPAEVGTVFLQDQRNLADSARAEPRSRTKAGGPVHRHAVNHRPGLLQVRLGG